MDAGFVMKVPITVRSLREKEFVDVDSRRGSLFDWERLSFALRATYRVCEALKRRRESRDDPSP